MIKSSLVSDAVANPQFRDGDDDDDDDCMDAFVKLFDSSENDTRYFCHICRRYGSRVIDRRYPGGDWAIKGMRFKTLRRSKAFYMKRHLLSLRHKNALKRSEGENIEKSQKGQPSLEDARKATENLCRTAQFMVDKNLGFESLRDLDALLHYLYDPIDNPVGNQNHSTKSLPSLLIANYNAGKDLIIKEINSFNPNTQAERKVTIAMNKGIVPNDARRQAIVASYVGDNGYIKEVLLSANRILDFTSKGHFDHFKSNCLDFMSDLKNIKVICTDSASVYVGKHVGFSARMTNDPDFSDNVIHLKDFCHSAELMFASSFPLWVKETLNKSSKLVRIFESGSKLALELTDFVGRNVDYHFATLRQLVETQYVEHGHAHVYSILVNLKTFRKHLPEIIDDPDLDDLHDRAKFVLDLVIDPVFITRLVFIDSVFVEVSLIQKKAQAHDFGPFELQDCTSSLFNSISCLVKDPPVQFLKMVEGGVFNNTYRLTHRRCYSCHLDYNWAGCSVSKQSILDECEAWIGDILSSLDKYLRVPALVNSICNFFSIDDIDLDTKCDELKIIYQNSNIEYTHCGVNCDGVPFCKCVRDEVLGFFAHFASVKEDFLSENKTVDYKSAFAFYLSSPSICRLGFTNIVRIIELAQLLKSNQSSTQRTFSVVANVVSDRSEGKYHSPEVVTDMVNCIVFNKQNFSIHTLDVENSRKHFLKNNDSEALKRTTPKTTVSTTVNRIIKEKSETDIFIKKRKDLSIDDPRKKKTTSTVESPPDSPAEVDDPLPVTTTKENGIPPDVSSPAFTHPEQSETISMPPLLCSCKEEEGKSPDSVFVGCSRQKYCLSKLERLATLKRTGGDWFHYYCVGLNGIPPKKAKWFCPLCKAKFIKQSKTGTRTLLSRELDKHDFTMMKFTVLKEDTLLSCFSHVMYSNYAFHLKVREALHNVLHDVISSDLFKHCWQNNSEESLNCKDPEQFLIYKIMPYYKLSNLPPNSENAKCYEKTLSVKDNFEIYIHLFCYLACRDILLLKTEDQRTFHTTCLSKYKINKNSGQFSLFYCQKLCKDKVKYSLIVPTIPENSKYPNDFTITLNS